MTNEKQKVKIIEVKMIKSNSIILTFALSFLRFQLVI